MAILDLSSLANTVDAVNEAYFYHAEIPDPEKYATAVWLASRQGKPGAYAGKLFARTDEEKGQDIALFTGERYQDGGGARHILGEETCRALILLGSDSTGVQEALKRATTGITARINNEGITGYF